MVSEQGAPVNFYVSTTTEDLAENLLDGLEYEEIINLIKEMDRQATDSVFTDMLAVAVKELVEDQGGGDGLPDAGEGLDSE